MTRRSKWWLGATIFTFINFAGGVYAAAMGEVMHTATHVVLFFAGAYVMWRLMPHTEQQEVPGAREVTEGLDHLQQSLDAIAIEVERIGEAQRFEFKLLEKRGEISPQRKDQ